MKFNPTLSLLAFGLCFSLSFGVAASATSPLDPEITTEVEHKSAVFAAHSMAVTANPHASKAAFEMLNAGGSAVDAAIAAQLVLTLVEPQSSGIGGGAFMLYFDASEKDLISFDGREKAPSAATPERFMKPNGEPMRWIDALVGGRSVGVPGVLAMLAKAHKQAGKLPWQRLFEPAIQLAENGFEVSPRLAGLLAKGYNPGLEHIEPAASYFYPNGEPLKAGHWLVNKPLANALKLIAKQGANAFYQGKLAQDMVARVQQSPVNAGDLSLDDLAKYEPVLRETLCVPYHSYQVCSMGPPSSGGIAVAQILRLLDGQPMKGFAQQELEPIHRFVQASRLSFADRNHYVGDPDFVTVPTAELLAESYISSRRSLIDAKKDMGKALPGELSLVRGQDQTPEFPSTSHMSIVDAQGNAVSMTTSIEMAFGSALMVNGYLLNNQLTDFSFTPLKNGELVANAVQPNKRPRSSMSPVMVFNEKGQLELIVGSPGGSRIIDYVAQTVVAVLDSNVDIQQAINMPRVTHRNDYLALEQGGWSEQTIKQFEQMGYRLKEQDLNSGLHGIQRVQGGWLGGADPRREGLAIGQ